MSSKKYVMICPALLLLAIKIGIIRSDPQDGFCSNIQQMYQHCSSQGHLSGLPRRGKAGPRGEKGEKGALPIINYEAIDEKLDAKFEALRREIRTEFGKCKQDLKIYQAQLEKLEHKLLSFHLTDCSRVSRKDAKQVNESGGVFDIYVNYTKTEVYCDLETDGGGWIVFQRRMDGSEDFFRGWDDYVTGFGNLTKEFWIGLETLHQITTSGRYELRVDLEDWEHGKRYAKYSSFRIGGVEGDYALSLSGYSGDASDSISRENGQSFKTKDHGSGSCAGLYKGAWWYGACHEANLNGLYHKGGTHSSYADGINWRHWRGYYYSMKFVEMKIRRV